VKGSMSFGRRNARSSNGVVIWSGRKLDWRTHEQVQPSMAIPVTVVADVLEPIHHRLSLDFQEVGSRRVRLTWPFLLLPLGRRPSVPLPMVLPNTRRTADALLAPRPSTVAKTAALAHMTCVHQRLPSTSDHSPRSRRDGCVD
jgi:hypothetical protein